MRDIYFFLPRHGISFFGWLAGWLEVSNHCPTIKNIKKKTH